MSRYTLVRNIALLLAAAGAHASALRGGTGVVSTLLGLGNSGWTWVFGAALIAVTLEAVRRGDALAQPEPQAEVILPEPVYDENGEEQYVRMPIPHAALYLENGRHTNLRALAKNQARVLVFVSATCVWLCEVFEDDDFVAGASAAGGVASGVFEPGVVADLA